LDITDTLNPVYLWDFPKSFDSERLARVGQSWSDPAIGRVKIEVGGELVERWVAFFGGGFDPGHLTGKGFYVVDLGTGDVIKEFFGLDQMNFSFAAPPVAVDTNFDGYIDRVYIGDLAGQMWVFDVSFDEVNKKSQSGWSEKRLFKAPGTPAEKHPIYHQAAVAFDKLRNPWVFFGTGDRENPKDIRGPAEGFYGVRDDRDGDYPREAERDLSNATSVNTFQQDLLKKGWYIKLEKTGQRSEKVLEKPTVFNRLVYFTTYTYTETTDPCSVTGSAKLYIVEYLSGGGAMEFSDSLYAEGRTSEKSKEIGTGIPSMPVISINVKGKATLSIRTTSGQVVSRGVHSPSSTKGILYWREVTQ
jgi:type IV pilus assembly protein PilY1